MPEPATNGSHASVEYMSPADPAVSLREAALSTLKAKRRKPAEAAVAAPLPKRPKNARSNEPVIMLDYGGDEKHEASTSTSTSANAPEAPGVDFEDGEIREEGELSDSEELNAAQQQQQEREQQLRARLSSRHASPPVPPRPVQRQASIESSIASLPLAAPTPQAYLPLDTSSAQSLLERLTVPSSRPSPPTTAVSTPHYVASPEPILRHGWTVDRDHARPGLQMTSAEYDAAKDIVLDLLGWGVPPSYLVDCGLSREIIFYVFEELNLRLPPNLDTTGLQPFVPTSGAAPPPPYQYAPKELPTTADSIHDRQSPTLVDLIGESPAAVSTDELEDMERQRRQELMARKAVQASRKLKQAGLSGELPIPGLGSVPYEPAAPESVDDFLNTIGSPNGYHSTAVVPPTTPPSMDVDDEIPGFLGRSASMASLTHTPQTVASNEPPPSVMPPRPPPSAGFDITPSKSVTPPETAPQPLRRDGSMESGGNLHRRLTKRPTAADFVDAELRGAGTPSMSSNGNGNSAYPRPLKTRKSAGGFAGVGTSRRLVIDVSDSEGEVEDAVMGDVDDSFNGSTKQIPASSTGLNTLLNAPTPSVQLTGTRPPSRLMSDVGLAEKEKEILKIKQMIAAKERSRLEKLSKLNSATPAQQGSAVAPTVVKQEDVEVESSFPTPVRAMASETSSANSPPTDGSSPTNAMDVDQGSAPAQTAHANKDDEASSSDEKADAMETSSSLQIPGGDRVTFQPLAVQEPRQDCSQSFFDMYPLLRSRARPLTSSSSHNLTATFDSDAFTSRSSVPDLKPLKRATLSRVIDPNQVLCKFEIPGGGICRDDHCDDVHPSRLLMQDGMGLPSDGDTTVYLADALPEEWIASLGGTSTSVVKISEALRQVRLGGSSLSLEQRVGRALAMLGYTRSSSIPS